ncbi:PD40 domain-containing protein [Micromonospora sp. KC721]|uniref:TolB family protein n=1 Tax=Micromonospora sp. KC721 TaxID=2530380 RepID=UPI001405359C|nr:PD40 domain-containing protein [Micromonospora sp. KC721]
MDSKGGQATEYRSEPFAASADGRYVAFTSASPNLMPDDTNNTWDVLVRDRRTGTTSRVSQSTVGVVGDSSSYGQSLSPDGRYVSFTSDATNLVPGDTNGDSDGFVHDRRTGSTSRVTLTNGGTEADARSYAPAISADARFVAFVSEATNVVPGDTNGVADIFLRDRQAGTTVRVSGTNADAPSDAPAISANGRYVTFTSEAALVPGDTNGVADVFIRDMRTGSLRRVNVSTSGAQANALTVSPTMSADGRFVAFTSEATNLVSGDTNGVADVFLRDLRAGTTVRASLTADGGQATGGSSYGPMMSADGRYVVFSSDVTDLVSGDTNGVADVFLRDLGAGTTVRASLAADGGQGNDGSYNGVVTRDGRHVAFASAATNLVPRDTNGVTDAFLRRMPH